MSKDRIEPPGTMEFLENSSKAQVRAACIVFGILVLAILPVLASHHLLLLDAPAHVSRLAILRDLLSGHKSLFYSLDTFFLPNIAFDVIGLGLAFLTSPEVAGRIFFALTLVLTLSGVAVLNRVAVGRWTVVPLASALLLYNLVSSLGFFSYAFGLALVPWALAARLKLDGAPQMISFLIGAGLGILLLLCHVFDFGIYAVMFTGFTLVAALDKHIGIDKILIRLLEPIPAGLLFLLMSTSSGSHARYDPHFWSAKLFGIAKSVTSGSMAADVAFIVGAAFFVLLLALRSQSRLTRSFIPGLLVLGALYFILPAKLASGSYVDSRMPIAIMLLTLAGLDVHIRRSPLAVAFLILVGTALVTKQIAIAVLWRSYDKPVDAITRAFKSLPDGAVIVQTECRPGAYDIPGVYRARQPSMEHLASIAAFENKRFAGSNYAIGGQQPIRVLPAYQPFQQLSGFEPVCTISGYRDQLARIESLAKRQASVGFVVPPLYYFLIRPPVPGSLAAEAKMVANGMEYELYAVRVKDIRADL